MSIFAVITPNNDTYTNPTMTTLFHLLNERGDKVYLFGPLQQPDCPENITNVTFISSLFKLSLLRNPRFFKLHWSSYLRIIEAIIKFKIKKILVVDPLGLIIGGRIKRFFGKRIHLSYLSFEIFFRNELTGYYLKLKEKEIFYSRFIDSILTQDIKRQDLLFKENKLTLSNENVALVPVSPLKIDVTNNSDIHKKFGISVCKKLAVYSGSVGEWCGTKAIIDAFKNGYWSDDYHLVFHTRRPIEESNEYYSDLIKMDQDKDVPFTLHAKPFDSFEKLAGFLSGFDLALALYYPNNDNPYYGMNMEEIGLSSGKFSTYMMLGLPTIVTPCRVYEDLLVDYNFGLILYEIETLANKMSQITSCKEDVINLYNKVLKPENCINNYISILLSN